MKMLVLFQNLETQKFKYSNVSYKKLSKDLRWSIFTKFLAAIKIFVV